MCSAPAPRTRRHGVEEADDADEVERDGAAAERVQLRGVDGLLQLGERAGVIPELGTQCDGLLHPCESHTLLCVRGDCMGTQTPAASRM